MKNTLIVVLLGLVLGLGFLYVRENQRAERWHSSVIARSNEVASVRQALQQAQRADESSSARFAALQERESALREEVAALQAAQTAALDRAAAAAATPAAADTAPAAESEQPAQSYMRSLAQLMDAPEMKQLLEEQMRGMFAPVYQSLLDELKLSPEDREAFTQLLTERIMTQIGPALALQQGGLDPAKAEQLKEEMKREREQVNTMIKEMLGDEGFERYADYERTEQDRIVVTQFARELGPGATALNAQSSDALIEIMSEERATAARGSDYQKPDGLTPDDLNEQVVEKMLRQERAIGERVRARAGACLTPQQLSAFNDFQDRQTRMREIQLRMALQMFKRDAPAQ